MDDHVLDVIAGAFAPTPSGVVGRQIAESVVKALVDAGYGVIRVGHYSTADSWSTIAGGGGGSAGQNSPAQAPVTEPAPPMADHELKERIARLEKHLGL